MWDGVDQSSLGAIDIRMEHIQMKDWIEVLPMLLGSYVQELASGNTGGRMF